jgi:hypothetical protein
MFGKFASKAFGLASVLATFIIILAACGSGTGGGGGGDSSSSRFVGPGSSAYVDVTAIEGYNVSIDKTNDGYITRDRYGELTISAYVEAKDGSEVTFDSVSVRLDGKRINEDNARGEMLFQWQVNYEIGKDYCDDEPHYVCLYAYVRGERTPAFSDVCDTFKRNVSVCDPSSASVPSSSSAVAIKNLSPILFGNRDTLVLNSQTGNRGVVFNRAEGVENPSDADIYWDCSVGCSTSPGPLKAGKSTVKIRTFFERYYALPNNPNYRYVGQLYWNLNEDYNIVSNNQSTTDFGLTVTDPNDPNEADYVENQYYMVRTNPSAPAYEWDSGDYLLLIRGTMITNPSNSNNTIKILAWKVN